MYGLVEPLVSVLFLALSTNACRYDFQPSALMFGFNDPVGRLWGPPCGCAA